MDVKSFFDPSTNTLTYVVYDQKSKDAVIIDPVLDYDSASSSVSRNSMMIVLGFINEHQLKVHYILETHAHADHLSSAHALRTHHFHNAKIGIGERITLVQETFKTVFNFPSTFKTDGSQFQKLFKDQEVVVAGSLTFKVIFTPGHTPACVSFLFGDSVFCGDALFMPDSGTGRCDFPGGDARALYHSIANRLYKLPDETKVFVGHDYQAGGRALLFQTTIGDSKKKNIQLRQETTESEYVEFRSKRDATLNAPRLLFPSLHVNIAAGALPDPESNGSVYLKIPIAIK